MGYSFHQPAYIIVHPWVCIPGFSQATAWIEKIQISAKEEPAEGQGTEIKITEYLDPEVYVYVLICMDSIP